MIIKALLSQETAKNSYGPIYPNGTLKPETILGGGGETVTEHFKIMPQLTLWLGFIKGKMKTTC